MTRRERRLVRRFAFVLASLVGVGSGGSLVPRPLVAQSAAPAAPVPMPPHAMAWGTETFVLSEVLELAPTARERAVRYDLVGWMGGASQRLWLKADGAVTTEEGRGRNELQALYGRLIAPFWDLQAGLWVDADVGPDAARAFGGAAVGLQGLAPGWFEFEPTVFVSTLGDVGARLTASYDLYLTQRLIFQPRLEGAAWLRARPARGIGAGIGETEFALRVRHELRRELAPYIGAVWERRFGESGALARAAGVPDREVFFTLGVRAWW